MVRPKAKPEMRFLDASTNCTAPLGSDTTKENALLNSDVVLPTVSMRIVAVVCPGAKITEPCGIWPPKSPAVAPAPGETDQLSSVEPVVEPERVSVISKTAPLPTPPSATEAWATLPDT